MMSVRLKIIKEVKRMADIISGNSRFGDGNNSKNKKVIHLVPEEQKQEENLDENEIIRIYGKRWDIEVFFKVCKSYLNLSKECNSLSYDAMTAHTAVVFTRYMMLSLKRRESNDNRSLRELFLYFSDEMSDITWIQAFQMLLQMFRTMLLDNTELSDEKINEIQQQKGGLSK